MNIAVVNILIRTNLPIDLHIVLAAPRALAANRDKMVLIERPNERRRLSQPLYKTGYGLFRERSEEHTSELQSRQYLVCRLLLEKKKKIKIIFYNTTILLIS